MSADMNNTDNIHLLFDDCSLNGIELLGPDINLSNFKFTPVTQKEILYDRSQQRVVVYYEKGTPYLIGPHTVEVYTDDYLVGSGSFIVKS